ncbi:AT-rich interactive domain-containing protein 6 isoform X2 [Vigna radiata var. radiata]|uniref:AT-rich interactive domain-containing protein 6 isoform X2 n=1 Tax=Vigna radiata var. radiata TaxID=3916 RepID=A0A3Q0F3I2_VIGRR|nr:AT-rich interactive domain-containing protein 6 isoform X2 [Vigna radiata var. radiata]
MSDAKEHEEAAQGEPSVVEENKVLVDTKDRVQPEDASAAVPEEEASNLVENGSNHVESESNPAENKKEEPSAAEHKNVEPEVVSEGIPQEDVQNTLHSVPLEAHTQVLETTECEEASKAKGEAENFPTSDKKVENSDDIRQNSIHDVGMAVEVKPEGCGVIDSKTSDNGDPMPASHNEPAISQSAPADTNAEFVNVLEVENKADEKQAIDPADNGNSNSKHLSFLDADHSYDGNESGTEEEQSAFTKELENFFRERSMEFKHPKFYGEGLNCLKLWRAVTRLGGYDKVTSCKLWRQVGESFKPPKTCTTVSWTFRVFYEKALLDYERHKTKGGELNVPITSNSEPMNIENQCVQGLASSGRARRDAAARAMQGWHSQRLLGNGEVSDPIIKDRSSLSMQKREKQLRSINVLKRKKSSDMVNAVKVAHSNKPSKPQLDTSVVDIGPPADWVKINVQKTVRVQSDPAGRLVISGEPENSDNPWGVKPFKKVVSLPSRIDTHQTSAVVTLHGQLFVRVPFEQSE